MKRQGGRLSIPEALRLLRQIAAALAAAHAKGIIHRDLKPDNIMIVPDPEAPGGERAKVLDFGIAKVLQDPAASGDPMEQSSQTRTGMMVGTPLYMAPEQCRGGSNIDDKADVYSLGVMLYRMLCGRPPFIGEGSGAVMAMHIYEPPPPLRQFEPSIPEDLAAMVHRLLVKDPKARPPMLKVAQELEALKNVHTTGLLSTTDLGLSASNVYLQNPRSSGAISTSQVGLPPPASNPSAPATASTGPSLSMTLGQSAAQMGPQPRRKMPLVAIITVGVSIAVGVFIFSTVALHKDDHGVEATPLHETGKKVRFTVTSDPPGATVLRALDQSEIGRTPWTTSQAASSGQLLLILRRAGYADRIVTLDQSANAVVKETLQPVQNPSATASTPPATTATPPTAVATPAPATGKWKWGKKGKAGKTGAPTAVAGSQSTSGAATPPPTTPSPSKDETNGRIKVVD